MDTNKKTEYFITYFISYKNIKKIRRWIHSIIIEKYYSYLVVNISLHTTLRVVPSTSALLVIKIE